MSTFSQTSASPMPTRYRPIWVRRLRNKSIRALRTHLRLPSTVSDNFQFWVFGRIFAPSRSISTFEPKCSTLAQLRRLRHHRCRPDIARVVSGGFEISPLELCRLTQAFLPAPTISDDFEFSVFGPIFDHFRSTSRFRQK